MPSVSIPSVPDVINHSLAYFHRRGQFEMYVDLQDYVVCDRWLAQDKMSVQGGNRIEMRIVPNADNGTFRYVGLFDVTDRPYQNSMQKIYADWCLAEAKAVYEARIMERMSGEAELYDYLKEKYARAMVSVCNGLEASAFNTALTSTDTLTPNGVPYWVNFLPTGTTDTTGQFGGTTAIFQDASTTTTIGGLSTATFPKHRNWAFNHTGINMTCIDSLRLAMEKTKFKVPRDVKSYMEQRQRRFAIYTSIDQKCDYERLVNAGPDNRNGDLNPFSGTLTFRGAEWLATPILDGKAYSPIYGIDRNNFKPIVSKKFWFERTEPMNDQDNPHLYTVQWDFEFNYLLENKRDGCFVGHTAF